MQLFKKWKIENMWANYMKQYYWLILSANNYYFYVPSFKIEWKETTITGISLTYRNVELFGIEIMEGCADDCFFFFLFGISFSRVFNDHTYTPTT